MNKVKFTGLSEGGDAVELELDGVPWTLKRGDEITEIPTAALPQKTTEIVERGISEIKLRLSARETSVGLPLRGEVKWFRDELDQRWVKFQTKIGGAIFDRVLPANLVVEVLYRKEQVENHV